MKTAHLIGIAIVVGLAGAVHGYWTNRWDAIAAGDYDPNILANSNPKLGGWEAGEATPMEETRTRPYSVSRGYKNRLYNKTAVASLISGHPGKVATHTPDVCYPGSGYTMKTGIERETIPLPGGGSAEFFVAEFQKSTATDEDRIKVRWSWCDNGKWVAPENPRKAFFFEPVLHKLYVVQPVQVAGEGHPAYRELVALLSLELSKQITE